MQNHHRPHERVTLSCADSVVRTKQSFKDECNINNIMARWKRTGVIDHLAASPPMHGDFDNAMDFQEAQNRIIAAQAAFDALPAHVRDRMSNDPAVLLDFMADPANQEESEELGLRTTKADHPAPPKAEPEPEVETPQT